MKWLVRFATLTACLALLFFSSMAVASDDDGDDGDVICTNECEYAHDGDCDDGGPGADYNLCEYGTDCADCGPRPVDGEEGGNSGGAAALVELDEDAESLSEGLGGEDGESSPEPDEDGMLCTNTCRHAHDGDCDDGGPGADYNLCEYGTDCADCGPRPADEAPEDGGSESILAQQQAESPEPDEDGMLCTNTCVHAHDGDCDDGGPDSDYSLCEYGTDCADCGPRPADEAPEDESVGAFAIPQQAESPEPNEDGMLCTNTCRHAHDGDCDDGGPGADFDLCEYGTDCADCGPRPPQQDSSSGADSSHSSSEMICSNTCEYADDGDCDDGGPGSDYDLCDYGTDCNDCGPRPPIENDEIICTDTCEHANDGDCDDGGPDSDYDLCDYGTDCSDCGPRPTP